MRDGRQCLAKFAQKLVDFAKNPFFHRRRHPLLESTLLKSAAQCYNETVLILDAVFRFSGLGLLLLLAIITLKSAKNSPPHLFLGLASISMAGLFLGYTPDEFDLPHALRILVRILDIPHLIFIWLFVLSLFERGFTVKLTHWLVGGLYCLPIAVARLLQFTDLGPFPFWATALVGLMSFAIASHVIAIALLGRADDLSASRRVSRVYFSVMMGFVTVSAAAIEVIFTGDWAVLLPTAKILTIWPAIIWVTVWLVQLRPNVFAFAASGKKKGHDPEKRARLHNALIAEIVDRKAYLEPRLTIPLLAGRLAVTQHTLRELINQDLGFKNFSDFINTYRIEAVKHAFTEPANRHKSILEIAMDHGFNSLSPFNKVFKNQVHLTPKEFRERVVE